VPAVTVDDLPDVPLDQPLNGPPGPYRRPAVVAPAPRWAGPLYLVLAVLLVPWIVYLGAVLPDRTTSAHWDIAWVGFDAMEFLALALTGWFAYQRSTWVEVAATASAVLLVVDAWFDITTAARGWDLVQAIVLGVAFELPLAGLSLWIARHAEYVNDTATRWLVERSSRQARALAAMRRRPAPEEGAAAGTRPARARRNPR
jgi:hypothetical protein